MDSIGSHSLIASIPGHASTNARVKQTRPIPQDLNYAMINAACRLGLHSLTGASLYDPYPPTAQPANPDHPEHPAGCGACRRHRRDPDAVAYSPTARPAGLGAGRERLTGGACPV